MSGESTSPLTPSQRPMRPDAPLWRQTDRCLRCGDPLPEGRKYFCTDACAELHREGGAR